MNFDNFLTAFSRDSLASKTYMPDDYESLVSGWGARQLGLNEQDTQYFSMGMKFTRLALDLKVIRHFDNSVLTEPYRHKKFGSSKNLTKDILFENKYVPAPLRASAKVATMFDTLNTYEEYVLPAINGERN